MSSLLFNVITLLKSGIGSYLKANEQKRKEIGGLMLSISDCISEAANSIRKSIYPHGKCAEMEMYANALDDIITPDILPNIGLAKVDLMNASSIEHFINLETSTSKEIIDTANQLEQVAGGFRGIGNILTRGFKP